MSGMARRGLCKSTNPVVPVGNEGIFGCALGMAESSKSRRQARFLIGEISGSRLRAGGVLRVWFVEPISPCSGNGNSGRVAPRPGATAVAGAHLRLVLFSLLQIRDGVGRAGGDGTLRPSFWANEPRINCAHGGAQKLVNN